MSTSDSRARARAARFREAVHLYLSLRGLPVSRRPEIRRLSEALRQDPPQSDLLGLPGWAVLLRDTLVRDLPGQVDKAAAAAEHDGASRYAVVWSRQSSGVQEAFVVMPLSVFADLLADGQEPLGREA